VSSRAILLTRQRTLSSLLARPVHVTIDAMRPNALLFDMDGTLTQPMLDFPRIKQEMGIGQRPILEALAELDPASRQEAQAVLHRHEETAAQQSCLNPGCLELLDWIARRRLPHALITRNSRRSVDVVLARHGLAIDVVITRDDGRFKPDPAPLWLACQRLHVEPATAWMIGDGVHDIEAGKAASMRTVWLSHGRPRSFSAEPWRTVADLPDLLNLLRHHVSDQ
jgi:HAD superfamily hydrolase (TIGR01509 family)